MIYTKFTKRAMKLCFEAHKNQVDKAGLPYVFHPFHVAECMKDELSTVVALLHDVVEDSSYTLKDLQALGFPPAVTDALALLTHDPAVPYGDYIAAIKCNPLASAVKLADLRHNSDLSRLEAPSEKDVARVKKYQQAIALLEGTQSTALGQTSPQPQGSVSEKNYRKIDRDLYYRKGVFRHFSEDCKCSVSMTARVDVTELVAYSKARGSKFYLNFLYLLCKALNSRDDYKMGYLWQSDELICYDVIHPTQYVFHEDTETCTPVYSTFCEDYAAFYAGALADLERAKQSREYGLDMEHHPNWFDASYLSWLSYDALNVELPDGYLFFAPIVNWGRYRAENGRLLMPVSVRLNHAIADGYLLAKLFHLLQQEIDAFVKR